PPLPARLQQAPNRARLAAGGPVRGRTTRDSRVVRRQPRLVGTTQRPGTHTRDRMDLNRGILVTGARLTETAGTQYSWVTWRASVQSVAPQQRSCEPSCAAAIGYSIARRSTRSTSAASAEQVRL